MLRPNTVFVTVGGLGFSPLSPGSLGALPAIPTAWLMQGQSWSLWLVLCAALSVAGVVAADAYLRALDSASPRPVAVIHDPQEIVLDEFIGCFIALAFVPWSWPWVLSAYVLFRALDIGKPGPIAWVERQAPGGLGVMGDDVLAGLVAGVTLFGVSQLL